MNATSIAVRGFDIRIQRLGSTWQSEKLHAWSPAGTLPAEWQAIITDPTVVSAICHLSSESRKQSQKRKLAAEYHAA